jgi:2-aminoadipate transaminase
MVVYEVIKDGFLGEHIPTIRSFYSGQCDVMLNAMTKHFPEGVTWTRPEGGMFIWVTLPKHIDSKQLLDEAIAQNVAFVPGGPFYANNPATNTLRLSFVTVSPERINEGIEKLGKLIKAKM